MIGRYTCKLARDAGLAVTMFGLTLTGAITADWIKVFAVTCGAGAAICAFSRVPLAMSEIQGLRSAVSRRL